MCNVNRISNATMALVENLNEPSSRRINTNNWNWFRFVRLWECQTMTSTMLLICRRISNGGAGAFSSILGQHIVRPSFGLVYGSAPQRSGTSWRVHKTIKTSEGRWMFLFFLMTISKKSEKEQTRKHGKHGANKTKNEPSGGRKKKNNGLWWAIKMHMFMSETCMVHFDI